MSKQELDAYLEELRRFEREILSSEDKANALLVCAGILDEEGNLAPQYAGE
ncbi:hypothetical protein [Paenibacillus cymbidii]|uniref:hypothetical protein n=1 Tax=Paenibacillus cymbidii TaxID=1639034 RepID=UPI001436BEC9|nr:hypothetical protein [Paenibacillus cymbidii]